MGTATFICSPALSSSGRASQLTTRRTSLSRSGCRSAPNSRRAARTSRPSAHRSRGYRGLAALEGVEIDVVDPDGAILGDQPEGDAVRGQDAAEVRDEQADLRRRLPRAAALDRPSVEDAEQAEQALDTDLDAHRAAAGREEAHLPVARGEAH